jgi:hypothetical protein
VFASRAALLVTSLIALSCGGQKPASVVTAPRPAADEKASQPAKPNPRRSCRSTRAPSRHPLVRPGSPVRINERTFALAWRQTGASVETVIVSLDARGGLVVTPIPTPFADPQAIGGDKGGLVIVSVATRGTGTLLRVALDADGALHPGTPTPLPEVVWGWPARILSDGSRATLEHTLSTPEQTLGGVVLHTIDLAARRVVATSMSPARAQWACTPGACTRVELTPTPKGPARARFVRRGLNGGETTREITVNSGCPAFYAIEGTAGPVFVAPGDPWRAVWVANAPPFLREAALDPALAPVPGCGSVLYPFASDARPGVIDGYRGPRTLLRWDAARHVFGARETLPRLDFERSASAAHPDGVIEVGWHGGSGMQHSPTDAKGHRIYFKHWYFRGGQVSLLRHEHGRWSAHDTAPLPLAEASGSTHDGYEAVVLRNGLHAAVLLAPQGGGDKAWLQPYLAPCAGP